MNMVRHRVLSYPRRNFLQTIELKVFNFNACVSSSMPSRKGTRLPSP
jgi:hypothetical protein